MKPKMSKMSLNKNQEYYDWDTTETIRWSNVMFLPFHPTFKLVVLISVIIKIILGPLQAAYPYLICTDFLDEHMYFEYLKLTYVYLCDPIYGIDTFLHIVHRQVAEEAMRREFLPKSAFLLTLDLISLIPFFRLMSDDECPPSQLFPNILAFTECLIIYRVVDYFQWTMTHKLWKILICFTLMTALIINCLTCFMLLLTFNGLCKSCQNNLYDWRSHVVHRFYQTGRNDTSLHIYGASFVQSFLINKLVDELKPNTYAEFRLTVLLMIFGYMFKTFVIVPKAFAEGVLGLRRICTFHSRVSRIINETKRRNQSPKAHVSVEEFYTLIWDKRRGITSLPDIITGLPRYLKIAVRQDLVWSVFYHSPTFRRTSESYKRWLCEHIRLEYKLPGEKLFTGPHSYTNLYYLKTGKVQLTSTDDSTSALLSVKGGTIFGDISFAVPPLTKRSIVKCLTFCELFSISRSAILKSLHKFPEERSLVMNHAKERMDHARSLYNCKQHIRGLDRSEDEGISWLKRRWWEIANVILQWKCSTKKDRQRCELPPEESYYHCAKFIGQLVLCSNIELQKYTLFAKVTFPWILLPRSTFNVAWRKIVIFTVYLVVILYPPNLIREVSLSWFVLIQYYVNLIYISDILVSLMTAVENQDLINSANVASLMFARFKSLHFILDVLSAIWIEDIFVMIGFHDFTKLCQFNRLMKVYVLFTDKYNIKWNKKQKPIVNVIFRIASIQFCFYYAFSYFFFLVEKETPDISTDYFFGSGICSQKEDTYKNCTLGTNHVLEIAIAWCFEVTFSEFVPSTFLDVGIGMATSLIIYTLFIYNQSIFMACLYLKLKGMTDYQCFFSNMTQHYKHHKIHPDLLKRLNRYLMCQWKYYRGMDVIHPNLLTNEPYDIHWKLHGETAEKIIGESRAFLGANNALIKELARKAKYMVVPQNTILFLFGVACKNVTWVVNGVVKCEFHDDKGNLLSKLHPPGEMLSVSSLFPNKVSLKSFATSTDCEILYLKTIDFYTIIKHYPIEWSYFEMCLEEFGPVFGKIYTSYLEKHRDYQKKLRNRIFHAKRSILFSPSVSKPASRSIIEVLRKFKPSPESRFVKFWLLFRAITVVISIICSALQGGSGAMARQILTKISLFCNIVCIIDIALKLYMAYYDVRGLIITDLRKCMVHYGTRGLTMDIIGIFPWHYVYSNAFSKAVNENNSMLLNTLSKFAHVYLVLGYFDYIADTPTVNYAYLMIAKWQVLLFLVMMGASHYFISKCISFEWNDKHELLNMTRMNSCWRPVYTTLSERPTTHQLHVLFAQSLNLAQCCFMRVNLGKFCVQHGKTEVGLTFICLGILFWFVMCTSQTLLVLKNRGNTMFQHGVRQLSGFLEAERVDKLLICRAERHFKYWWTRTKGINFRAAIIEKIGVIFRQDFSYYFFKRTLRALDTLINAGEDIDHQLSAFQSQMYFLPGEDIIREMDLVPYVYVVHRGRVLITQNDKRLAVLTKGSIFGQLQGTKLRPIVIAAKAKENADVLQIPIKQFQEIITDKVRQKIAQNPQSANDYMAIKKIVPENPYNSIQYILRGRKTIWLPWMTQSIEAHHHKVYTHWLFCVYLVGPAVSSILVLIQKTLPIEFKPNVLWVLLLTDILLLVHFIANFWSTYLVIEDNRCVHEYKRLDKLSKWSFYFDVSSLIVPMLTIFTHNYDYQLARLLRLHLFTKFNKHFCSNFRSDFMPVVLKTVIVLLIIHALTCAWLIVACRRDNGKQFPWKTLYFSESINKTIDYDEWVLTDQRQDGCARLTKSFKVGTRDTVSFIVPKYWQADYIIALTYIIVLQTRTNMDHTVPITLEQTYLKIIITTILYLLEMWISSITISAIYSKIRELYLYDYQVANLDTFLKNNGLSKNLLDSVRKYTSQLWARQRGYWLPEITQLAPTCLREDMFGELYMHHLQKPSLLHHLPPYFLRQLVARLHRIVVFPGQCIVKEGDILPTIYFIHEGEVEKWCTDDTGEMNMVSLLVTNGYFGLIPGLIPDTPYQFSYYTRTVVDLVFLRRDEWKDLLDGYPQVSHNLLEAARKLKQAHAL